MYTNAEDVLAISDTVDEIIAEASLEYGDLVSFKPFIRDSEQIEGRLGTLSISGLLGLLLGVGRARRDGPDKFGPQFRSSLKGRRARGGVG